MGRKRKFSDKQREREREKKRKNRQIQKCNAHQREKDIKGEWMDTKKRKKNIIMYIRERET